ncbi:MAG: hypothetical protein AAF637_21335, partial [Pseudomonadota bacterium]
MRLATCFGIAALGAALAFAAAPANADDYDTAVNSAHSDLADFQQWMKDEVAALEARITALEEEIESGDDDNKDHLEKMLEDAEKMMDQLGKEIGEIGDSTSQEWGKVKASALAGSNSIASMEAWFEVNPELLSTSTKEK